MSRTLSVLALTVLLFGVARAQTAQPLVVGHNSPPGGPHSIGVKVFAQELERRLPGRFFLDEKGGVSMGPEPDLWDAVRLGSIDMACITSISLSPGAPELEVLNVPFLFRDSAHAAAVLEGPVGKDLENTLRGSGVVVLAWGELGFRQMTTTSTPIRRPADLAGLRMRLVPNAIYRATFSTLGAKPVEMYLPELYNSIKKGLVDGEDNPLLVFKANHLDEVQRYVMLTRHFYNPLLFLMHAETFEALSATERAAVREAAQAGAAATRRAVAEREADVIAGLRADGLVVIDDIDREAFVQALAPLEPGFERQFGAALLRKIRQTP